MTPRRLGTWLAVVAALLVATLINLHIVAQKTTTIVTSQREGCARVNVLRQAIYDNGTLDAGAREAAAAQFTGSARASVLASARQDRRDASALIVAVAPVALVAGSPKVDCEKAYPLP